MVFLASLLVYHTRSSSKIPFCEVLAVCPSVSLFRVVVVPLLLTSLFFLGPLIVLKDTYTLEEFIEIELRSVFSWIFVRNYIVAPLTEEFIFRSTLLAILIPCWESQIVAMSLSSIFFGLAHSHHYIFQKLEGCRPISFIQALVQIAYTFTFGMYSSSLFLKTNSILTSISLHIFCNFMGFPDFEVLTYRKLYYYVTIAGAVLWLPSYVFYLS